MNTLRVEWPWATSAGTCSFSVTSVGSAMIEMEGVVDDGALARRAPCSRSTTVIRFMPRCWAAKQMTVVVPPKAAAVVALSKVSALTMPAAEQLLDMGVRVDAARQHQLAPGVDLAGAGGQVAADGRDRPAADADVGVELVDRRADPASAHHAVVLGLRHGAPPSIRSARRQCRQIEVCASTRACGIFLYGRGCGMVRVVPGPPETRGAHPCSIPPPPASM